MLLRFHELPPGYRIDEDVGCGRLDPEGAEPPLAEFIVHHFPRFCAAQYERIYPIVGSALDPPLVATAVVDFRTAATARSAAAILPELVGVQTGDKVPQGTQPAFSIAAETRLFHGSALVDGHGRPASVLTWRQGRLIGMTLVGGDGRRADDRDVARLARKQRAHMRRPTPYPAAARNDIVVPLDNPAIKLPVFWLGRSFDPGAGAKPLLLTSAYGPLGPGEGPLGSELELWYGEGALRIATWPAASWHGYAATKLGRELLTWHCTSETHVDVPDGQATIYSGYTKDYASCPGRPPSVFAAVVELPDVVLGLDLPACFTCLNPGPPNRAELETAIGDLRLRQPRRFGG